MLENRRTLNLFDSVLTIEASFVDVMSEHSASESRETSSESTPHVAVSDDSDGFCPEL
jgi:hypothetical protein